MTFAVIVAVGWLVFGADLVGWSPLIVAFAGALTAVYAVWRQQQSAKESKDAKRDAATAAERTVGIKELEAAVEAQGVLLKSVREERDYDRREMQTMRTQLAAAHTELAALHDQVARCESEKTQLRLDYERTLSQMNVQIRLLEARVAELGG